MKWCRIQTASGPRFAIVEDDRMTEVDGSPFADYTVTSTTRRLDAVELLVPVIPPTFYAAGLNYRPHVIEMAALRGVEPSFPPQADIGYRANNALIPTGEPIVIPADAGKNVQYEGELVVVIGKKAKHVSEDEALDHVFGYTLGNDFSEREWQHGDRTLWRGKNADTFKPMGPYIVTDLDPDELDVTVRLNGKQMITFGANTDAIFTIQTFIARMTEYLTLYPGDVIWMGTDGTSANVVDGDVIEVEVPQIGVLTNPVVKER